jgi:uncharacterized integral membrane protein
MTRLVILAAALAVIARTRVPLLPGWTVPLPALLAVVVAVLCGTALACYGLAARRARDTALTAAAAASPAVPKETAP